MVKERPILFSAPMVKVILDGKKTQTRRIVKGQQPNGSEGLHKTYPYHRPDGDWVWCLEGGMGVSEPFNCKYGEIGERLCVRETFLQDTSGFIYRADGDFEGNARILGGWRPSIFMTRSASRILLEIKNVHIERLQDISEEDAVAEGCISTAIVNDAGDDYTGEYAVEAFRSLWESIKGMGSWDLNPWVWVVEFKVLEINGQ